MSKTAREICEDILCESIRYNIQHEILPSENAVAEHLLARGDELADVYEELYEKLRRWPRALQQFMGLLLSAQAHWSRDEIARARRERDALEEVNTMIKEQARTLAALLEQRTELHNTSGFSSGTLYHIRDVIDRANEGNGHHRTFLRERLLDLCGRYDLKYWPELSRCVLAIANDAANSKLEPTDPLTGAATFSSRPSTSDSVMGFLAYIEDCRGDYDGALPRNFQVSDKNMATLMSVLLDLPVNRLLTAEYIKGRRRKARELAVQ